MNNFFETGKKGKRARKRRIGWIGWAIRTAFNLALIMVVAVLVFATGLYLHVVREYQDRLDSRYPALPQDSSIYDSEGNKIGEFNVLESRKTLGPDEFGDNLPRAVVAVEDRRFYEHLGFDPEGVGRAAWADIRSWEVQEGGSTITEQLIKNLYIPQAQRIEVSFWRRFTQAALAFAYEQKHTKKEILTTYLNTVYFGNGAYGAETAAHRYFGKGARDITLSEAAALAGFLDAPSTYYTGGRTVGTENATTSRDSVLYQMHEQGMISKDEMQKAMDEPLRFDPELPPVYPEYEPFIEKVRREVEEKLGPGALERGGLQIHTTLDPDMQREAIATTKEVLYEPDDPSAAVVSVEPQSGAVRAIAGQAGDFNLALDADPAEPGGEFRHPDRGRVYRTGIRHGSQQNPSRLRVRGARVPQDQPRSLRVQRKGAEDVREDRLRARGPPQGEPLVAGPLLGRHPHGHHRRGVAGKARPASTTRDRAGGEMTGFTVFPAIDLRGGRCVRLRQGDFDRQKEYDIDPVGRALEWERRGAKAIHVVDLDGAKEGRPVQFGVIRNITSAVDVPVQCGGGVRTLEDLRAMRLAGASRVVVGTAAVGDRALRQRALEELGSSLVVAVDARDGVVVTHGWRESSGIGVLDLAAELVTDGVGSVLFTDVVRDGMDTGAALEGTADLARRIPTIASGGVRGAGDVAALSRLPGVVGVIVGTALYEGRVTLEELLEVANRA